VNEELLKSTIILLQNEWGDKEILIRIINDLKNDKKLFGPDKEYLKKLIEKHLPEDKNLI